MIATMPESRERDQIELKIQMMLGPLIVAVAGIFVAGACDQHRARAGTLPPRRRDARDIRRDGCAVEFRSRQRTIAREPGARRPIAHDGRAHDSDLATAVAHNAMGGDSALWMGEFPAAREHSRDSRRHFRPRSAALPADDARRRSRRRAAILRGRSISAGYPDQAKRRMDEANEMALQLRRPFSVAFMQPVRDRAECISDTSTPRCGPVRRR